MLHTSDYLLFFYAYVTLPRPPPLPVTKCHTWYTPSLPLERDVIIEWPLVASYSNNLPKNSGTIAHSKKWRSA